MSVWVCACVHPATSCSNLQQAAASETGWAGGLVKRLTFSFRSGFVEWKDFRSEEVLCCFKLASISLFLKIHFSNNHIRTDRYWGFIVSLNYCPIIKLYMFLHTVPVHICPQMMQGLTPSIKLNVNSIQHKIHFTLYSQQPRTERHPGPSFCFIINERQQ